jgi:hypothetical protein
VTYEAPAIEARVEVGGPLIGTSIGSPTFSPAWRRTDDQRQEQA